MPIYTVYAKETVFYEIRIDAETKEAAYQEVMDYGGSDRDIVDSDDFTIDRIEEKTTVEAY